jgi:Mg-chelatase subunit ChlD
MALMEEDPMAEPEKTVIFCCDISGSMGGSRIASARTNMLKIYDEYINDGDSVSFVAFNHKSQIVFPLTTIQGNNRASLRTKAANACVAGGGTAFFDALLDADQMIKKAEWADWYAGRTTDKDSPRWIMALTDGADQHSKNTLKTALDALQKSGLDLVIVGVELGKGVGQDCEKLATASDKSMFVNATDLDALDEAFEAVAELICD